MDRLLELTDAAQASHFWFAGFREFLQPAVRDVVNGRRDLRMLDCGCGAGHNLAMLAPHGRVFGFDLSAGGLALAQRRRHPLAQADATHLPYATGSFDLVTSFDVMQCVPDDTGAVREMARVLRPGGTAIITVAAFDLLRGDHSVVWNEVRRYTPGTATRLVEQAGLRADRVSFMFASLLPVMLPVRLMQRVLRPVRGLRDDTDISVPAAPINAVLTAVLRLEAAVARTVPMPIGTSLLVVARKPYPGDEGP
jgi:SAM-dependent methyltransferase